MELAPGAVIAGRYRVDARVGSGGMGEVWAGEHLGIGVKVAIKTLLPAASLNREVVIRFKREALLLARIRSDFVARILDFVEDDDYGLVLVMEYVEGDPLSKVLGFRKMTVEEAIDLGADVAGALCDLHAAHVVHRDLKPGNVILMPLAGGERKRAVVVDFGVSRMVSDGHDEDTITGITRANMAVGTVEYMAPEQVLNSRDVTTSSDCYALGAILFRAVAGRHVYGDVYDNELAHTKLTKDAPPLETGRTDRLARGLERTVARCLKRRPAERWKNAEEMVVELEALRDLARSAGLDGADTTTVDGSDLDLETLSNAARPPRSEPGSSPSSESVPRPSLPSNASSPAVVTSPPELMAPPPRRGGVSSVVAAVSALLALAGGVALGMYFAQRGALAPPAPAQPAVAETSPSAQVPRELEPAPTARPDDTGTVPAATAAPEPQPIDLGELEAPASPSKPRSSKSSASATATATAGPWIPPVDATTGAVTPGATSKPTAAPKTTAAPSAAVKAPPPPEKINF